MNEAGTSTNDSILLSEFADVLPALHRHIRAEPDFAALVEDFLDAARALRHWRRDTSRHRHARVAEYDELVKGLRLEIRLRLGWAASPSQE